MARYIEESEVKRMIIRRGWMSEEELENSSVVADLPSAQPEILKDGTLVIDLTLEQLDKVNRVLLKSERWCKLMYMDAERKNEGRE